MPRNKISNDLDHVKKDPKPSNTPKGRPPDPWPLPKYVPLKITRRRTHGQGHLPNTIAPDDPYGIFSLFFSNETIQTLVDHTNEYAVLYPGPENRITHLTPTELLVSVLGSREGKHKEY